MSELDGTLAELEREPERLPVHVDELRTVLEGDDDEAKKAVREGRLTVTIDQLPESQGYKGVAMAVEMVRGATPPEEVMVEARVVDRAALD